MEKVNDRGANDAKKKTHTHTIIPHLDGEEGGDEGGDTYGNDNDNNLIPVTLHV